MTHDVYFQFFQTPEQLRRVGARGGKATARHRRERRSDDAPLPQEAMLVSAAPLATETTAAAIALLDARYPWLQGAEKRFSNGSTSPT